MKPSNACIAPSIRIVHFVTLLAALAVAAAIVTWAPAAALATTNAETKTPSAERPLVPKPVTYKSRDYGVSFVYPWQYGFVNAKTIAQSSADASLRPKSDGHDSQITLARIDIPKGYYDGTDFESGYFTLSLDPQIASESECEATFHVLKGGKIETDSVNGAGFHWIDTETAGGGEATKLRRYVTYSNGACYEVEMGVNTRNQNGLAREVNPDRVMLRLDAILRTLQIAPDQSTVTVETASSTQDPKPEDPKTEDRKPASHN
ncbi:MAG TPA: hypothetical protein VK699_14690 [Terriglobales bacterium]|jgi:hypothetical protein|nr:hypothetical protein [Terriglobales bacterium]